MAGTMETEEKHKDELIIELRGAVVTLVAEKEHLHRQEMIVKEAYARFDAVVEKLRALGAKR